MSWTEIVVEVNRSHAELLSDALMEAGALSVSVEDADEGTEAEQPLFGEPGMPVTASAWERSRVVALADDDTDFTDLVSRAAAACQLAPVPPFSLRPVADQDWVRLTQSQFAPIHIGKNIWVVPSWHDAPDANGLILELDPGLAFGTGSHPTTRLCMEWLEDHPPRGLSVLDYGCGSGILAMVAEKLGASEVAGVDIDPQAIESANYNAQRNGCRIDYYLPEAFSSAVGNRTYDVVIANILSGPLKLMASMLCERIAPGGTLVLSGILKEQADDVIAAYSHFLPLSLHAEHEGWIVLAGRAAPGETAAPGQ